ncbi:MAG: Na-translocating system protein MpsC family protein [Solirubrobacteraceae bacterium]
MTGEVVLPPGKLGLVISNAVVRALASTTGRGPTRAKTTLGENAVFVVLEDTLTRGELNLVQAVEIEAVLDLRRLWQKLMRTSCSREIS